MGKDGCKGDPKTCDNCFERRVIYSLSENAAIAQGRQGQRSQQFGKLEMYLPTYLAKCRDSGPHGNNI